MKIYFSKLFHSFIEVLFLGLILLFECIDLFDFLKLMDFLAILFLTIPGIDVVN